MSKKIGRPLALEHLKKMPYSTKLPKWLLDWIRRPGHVESAPVMLERALCQRYDLTAPNKEDIKND